MWSAVVGAGAGAVIGRAGEKSISNRLSMYFPKSISDILGSVFGSFLRKRLALFWSTDHELASVGRVGCVSGWW
jgi:small basic protein